MLDSNESAGQFSPDARWVAYQSDESGRSEVFLQALSDPGEKTQVSTAGGAQVRWNPNGEELFYIGPDGRLMAVPVRLPPDMGQVELGQPIALFRTMGGTLLQTQYAVSRDGQRFLLNRETEMTAPITVVLNWKGTP